MIRLDTSLLRFLSGQYHGCQHAVQHSWGHVIRLVQNEDWRIDFSFLFKYTLFKDNKRAIEGPPAGDESQRMSKKQSDWKDFWVLQYRKSKCWISPGKWLYWVSSDVTVSLICFCCSHFDSGLIFNSQENWERVRDWNSAQLVLQRCYESPEAEQSEPSRFTASFHEKSAFKWCTHEKVCSLCWSWAFLRHWMTKHAMAFCR